MAIYYPSIAATGRCPSSPDRCIMHSEGDVLSHARTPALSALYIFDLNLSASFLLALRSVNSFNRKFLFI